MQLQVYRVAQHAKCITVVILFAQVNPVNCMAEQELELETPNSFIVKGLSLKEGTGKIKTEALPFWF